MSGSQREERKILASQFVRQFVPRRPYRMLIKRVSTVSKYLTAAAAATTDRSTRATVWFSGSRAEPNVCQWASTVVPRHRVGGPRPPANRGTPLCYGHCYVHYILSFCPSFSPTFSPLPLPSHRRISLFHSSPCSFSFPVQGDTHARTLSPSVSLFLSSFPFSLLVRCVSLSLFFLVRLHRFAHLVTRSNMRLTVVVAERRPLS